MPSWCLCASYSMACFDILGVQRGLQPFNTTISEKSLRSNSGSGQCCSLAAECLVPQLLTLLTSMAGHLRIPRRWFFVALCRYCSNNLSAGHLHSAWCWSW
eukprot:symbB.v1.2.017519.t1/scaffold1370.1/size122994/10